MSIELKPTSFDFGQTSLEHLFIDEFLPYCNLVQLKVYIAGLRFAQEKKDTNLTGLAKFLDLDYIEVVEAFRYWQKEGLVLLQNEYENSFDVVYLSLRDIYLKSNFESIKSSTSLDYSLWHQELFNDISSLLSFPLTEMECQSLGEFLQDKEINKELVLKAYDESKKKKYRNREAMRLLSYWAQHQVTSPEEVEAFKERANLRNYQYKEILTALGHPYRQPNAGEKEVMDIWLDDYKLKIEDILSKITSVTRSTTNPSMNYLHAVFTNTLEEGKELTDKKVSREEREKSLRNLGIKL